MARADSVTSALRSSIVRISTVHFAVLFLFAVQTIVFHASKVAVPEVIHERWLATSALLVASAAAWYLAKNKINNLRTLQSLVWILIIADLLFAAFCVNLTRGYASNFVALFFFPLIVAAVLRSKSALITTALLCIAVYGATILNYFFQNFNEGYMAELYGELALYSGLFLSTAYLLWGIISQRNS